jgi:hypothetical protein
MAVTAVHISWNKAVESCDGSLGSAASASSITVSRQTHELYCEAVFQEIFGFMASVWSEINYDLVIECKSYKYMG